MDFVVSLFYIIVFPGFLFLSAYGLLLEFLDRKLYARFQNRIGPPWYQPLADFIKLISKENIVPKESDKRMFRWIPVFALAAASTAILYIPIWSTHAVMGFTGDVLVIMYLLTIPTLTFFLAGWYSSSLYATMGAVRVLTQLFAYEVPLMMSILAPGLLAGSWSLSDISAFYAAHPLYSLLNLIGFVVAIIAVQGKLERVPFDIPEAETEIVAGSFVEYSGKLLAIFRMTIDTELVVTSAILSAVYIPWFSSIPILGFLIFLVKTLFILVILATIKSVTARLRIEQMVNFCWKVLAPLALLQVLISLVARGLLLK